MPALTPGSRGHDLSRFEDFEMRSESGGYDLTTLPIIRVKEALKEAREFGDEDVCVKAPGHSELNFPLEMVEAYLRQIGEHPMTARRDPFETLRENPFEEEKPMARTIYAIVSGGEGAPLKLVGPVENRNEIKTALRPWKLAGAEAVVIEKLSARRGTSYSVQQTQRNGRRSFGSGLWARGQQRDLTWAEREMLAAEAAR